MRHTLDAPMHLCICARRRIRELHTMEIKTSEIVEVPETVRESEGEGYAFAGIYGDTSVDAMTDRQKRKEGYRERVKFRECVSCDRCGHCLEIRGFYRNGKEYIKTLLCIPGEFETTPFNTCDQGYRNRKNRRKVIYDLANAPRGFEAGLHKPAEVGFKFPGDKRESKENEPPKEGYRGGSKFYKRADGDERSEGSGKIPRGLTN